MELLDLLQDKNTLVGLLFAALCGITVRWLDKTLRQRTDYFSEASRIRQELRNQIDANNKIIDEKDKLIADLNSQIDDWRKRYWDEVAAHNKMESDE